MIGSPRDCRYANSAIVRTCEISRAPCTWNASGFCGENKSGSKQPAALIIDDKIAIGHPQAGPEDRDERDSAGQNFPGGALQRGLDGARLGRKVPGDLVDDQRSDFIEQGAELTMIGGGVAQFGELDLHNRVIDHDDVGRRGRRRLRIPGHSRMKVPPSSASSKWLWDNSVRRSSFG